ncbi:hypothetical protein INT45_011076 [Circinella minor]|uniref:Uncharacterized protein n=1 Tax=Circinella minor TaxID=1195481 RepID=A0A8H7SDE4_9FUNG|nr:hypothetical protein INT45_011076 [Circinella minor]
MRQIPMDSVSNFVSRIFVRSRSTTKKHRSAPPQPNNNNNDHNATHTDITESGTPTFEENNKNIITPPTSSSEPTDTTTPINTTTTSTTIPDSFDSLDDVSASPTTDHSVNVNTLEFAASRDLAFFLDSGWSSSVKKSHDETQKKLTFPQFEYLLHDPTKDQERPATSNGPPRRQRSIGQQFFNGTLPRKAKNLSLTRPKSAVNLIKRVRSTPNFKDQQQQQQ